jgi:hypothetical protein
MGWLCYTNKDNFIGGIMNEQLKAMLASYGRSVLGAASTLYLAGVTEPTDLIWSLVGAIAPVAIRYINPNDPAFGRAPKVEEVEAALANVKPKKAPAKKAVAKKPATKKPASK